MIINFFPLNDSYFPLLLKWLNSPHVKQWWDQDIKWNESLISKKYKDYVAGYKVLELGNIIIRKPIYPFIIEYD